MKNKFRISIGGLIAAICVLLFFFLIILTPINLRSGEFWFVLIVASTAYALGHYIGDIRIMQKQRPIHSEGNHVVSGTIFFLPAGILAAFLLLELSGGAIFHAGGYASILTVEEREFTEDLPESAGTDYIALMDSASAAMLGDREIGSLSNVVSQYDVSDSYIQIDYQGAPIKVSALDYAGFFKWINNRDTGVPGYVTVDPVSMSANYESLTEEMKYVPSAYLLEDAGRHIWFAYPTTMWGNLHFEVDEEGKPFYVASVYDKKISLLSGTTVSGCIVLDPVTGSTEKYDLADVPRWVDMVYDGDILCEQYNWHGELSGGFWNSIIGKKGCRRVTSYTPSEGDDEETAESSDYGYVAKDGDIWIYTGVTSVNSDSSNIGFLLANERTGEAHYFNVSGADESSAMAAAEGEVQEKRYQASFPSLINVEGTPTYIMVLKDASGLVKLYAAVNVEQYNLVTTASTQAECLAKYKTLMGIEGIAEDDAADGESEPAETETAVITIKEIRDIDISGNTWLYFITEDEQIFKAKAADHEEMLLLGAGDVIEITFTGNEILSFENN